MRTSPGTEAWSTSSSRSAARRLLANSVLDASALLALLGLEQGAETVAQALRRRAAISAVNLVEVLTRLSDRGEEPTVARERITNLGITGQLLTVVSFNEAQAAAAAQLRQVTRQAGLSLGDRACLALARTLGVPALTADRAWASLSVGVEIKVVR